MPSHRASRADRRARKITGGQKGIVRTLSKAEYGRLFVIAARRLG